MVRLRDYLQAQAESWGSIAHKDMRDVWEGDHLEGLAYAHARQAARFARWYLDLVDCEADHPPEPEYTAWVAAGEPDVEALVERVAFLEGMLKGAAAEMSRVSWAFPQNDGRHARALHLAETWRSAIKTGG